MPSVDYTGVHVQPFGAVINNASEINILLDCRCFIVLNNGEFWGLPLVKGGLVALS